MDEPERHAARMAASTLPPPVVLRETVDQRPAADGPAEPLACADGRSPR